MFIHLIRYKHTLKNLIIFVPLFFSKNILIFNDFLNLILYFISFCLASFSIYIMNDLFDINQDKQNPQKKDRILASGKLNKNTAVFIAISLFAINIFFLYFINNIHFSILILIYYSLNLIYSTIIKKIIFLDILLLCLFYIIRLISGHLAINLDISFDIVIILFISVSIIGFGKRYSDFEYSIYYNKLTKLNILNVIYTLTFILICYYIYFSFSDRTIVKYGSDFQFTLLPFIFGLLMYFLALKLNKFRDPIDIFTKDFKIIISCLLYFLICFITVYIF